VTSLVSILLAWVAGWFWVAAADRGRGTAAARRLLAVSVALPLGLGATSALFILMRWVGAGPRPAAMLADLLFLAGGAALWWFTGRAAPESAPDNNPDAAPAFRWTWIGYTALVLCCLFLAGSIVKTSDTVPWGDWDAWAIWNLRAKLLSAETGWNHAAAPELIGHSHPEYPLLWSGVIAKAWSWNGGLATPAAPMAAGVLSVSGVLALMLGALWRLRGAPMGLMASLTMLGCVSIWQYAAVQYADIPLSLFMLAALTCALLAESEGWPPGWMALSGALAAMSVGIKDEGIVFAVSAAAAVIFAARKRAVPFLVAAAPFAVMAVVYKVAFAPAYETLSLARLADVGRLGPILAAAGTELFALGHFPAHPLLAAAACAVLLGFRKPLPPLWPLAPVAALGAGYVAAFWMTTADLNWHLQTAAGRLLLQATPLAVMCLFLLLRTPVGDTPSPSQQRKKR
jgi:hypothetical protein